MKKFLINALFLIGLVPFFSAKGYFFVKIHTESTKDVILLSASSIKGFEELKMVCEAYIDEAKRWHENPYDTLQKIEVIKEPIKDFRKVKFESFSTMEELTKVGYFELLRMRRKTMKLFGDPSLRSSLEEESFINSCKWINIYTYDFKNQKIYQDGPFFLVINFSDMGINPIFGITVSAILLFFIVKKLISFFFMSSKDDKKSEEKNFLL